MIKFVQNLRKRFTKALQQFVCKNSCRVGVHSTPLWKTEGFTSQSSYYYGICRNCRTKITQDWSYRAFDGPLYEGIPVDKNGKRDLERIIQNCVVMFLKDQKKK